MAESSFKWKHFVSDIFLLYARWYLKYPLSNRNLSYVDIEIICNTTFFLSLGNFLIQV